MGVFDVEVLVEDVYLVEGDLWVLWVMVWVWEVLDVMLVNEVMWLYVKVLDEEKLNWWDGVVMEVWWSNCGMYVKGGMEVLLEVMCVECGRWEFLEYVGTKSTARF